MRVFWNRTKYDKLRDGRDLLTIEFTDRGGAAIEWTPRWSEVLTLAELAHTTETGNVPKSPFEPMLLRALGYTESLDIKSNRDTLVVQIPHSDDEDDEYRYCPECEWHWHKQDCEWMCIWCANDCLP